VRAANKGRTALGRAARQLSERISTRPPPTTFAGRTAILIVNGFDRHSASPFDVEEARRFPWIELCLQQLERYTTPSSSYDILVWDNSFLPEHLEILEANARVSVFSEREKRKDVRHGRALDRLLREVPQDTEYVVTLDTDSFPIRDGWLDNLIGRLDGGASIAGVWRDEMAPKITPYVHPSCLVARRNTLLELEVDFARKSGQDVGQNITEAVVSAGGLVSRLRRSNARNPHFLMAGIYGDLVYHHGAGSRRADFWTSSDMKADEAAREALRDAAFNDLDGLIDVLTGDVALEGAAEIDLETASGLSRALGTPS
jgi:Glycosyl transferase family 2